MRLDVKSGIARVSSKTRVLMQFLLGQGISMIANVLFGLLCVRLLPATEYSIFVVVYGIQAMLLILMDANFSGTLIPLIGDRLGDKKLIAGYVSSLQRLSVRMYLLLALAAVFGIPLLLRHRDWSHATVAGIVTAVLISTWCARMGAAYGAVLILFRDRSFYYRVQLLGSTGSLVLLLAGWKLHVLSAFVAISLNLAQAIYSGCAIYLRARKLLGTIAPADPEKQRAIIRLALPNMPQTIFYAVQGQVSLFLITYLGHATGIASVGALGRLGQLFALFLQANSLLLEPYFAKLPRARLATAYLGTVAIAVCIASAIVTGVVLFPQPLTWILGSQYGGLTAEIRIAIIASAISFVSGVLWGIHIARRFVFWWNSACTILSTLIIQSLFIWKADMSTVRAALLMGLAVNVAALVVNAATGFWGFARGPRQAENGLPEAEHSMRVGVIGSSIAEDINESTLIHELEQ